jgi:hypothetical protein
MSELVFIKEKSTDLFHRDENNVRHKNGEGQVVYGVEMPGHKPLFNTHFLLTGTLEEESFVLDEDLPIERIYEFFERTQTIQKDERPFYNCHNFAIHALTKTDVFKQRIKCTPWTRSFIQYSGKTLLSSSIDFNNTEPATGYAMQNEAGLVSHSIVGLNRHGFNVSIFGKGGDMVITDNDTAMHVYGGMVLRQSIPPVR